MTFPNRYAFNTWMKRSIVDKMHVFRVQLTFVLFCEYISLLPILYAVETVVGIGEELGHDSDDVLRHGYRRRLRVQPIAQFGPGAGGRGWAAPWSLGGDQIAGRAPL